MGFVYFILVSRALIWDQGRYLLYPGLLYQSYSVCVYIYIYIYKNKSDTYAFKSSWLRPCVYMWLCVCVTVYLCVRVYVCMDDSVWVCVSMRVSVCLSGFCGISTLVGYLTPNLSLYKWTVLLQTIHFSISMHLIVKNISISSNSVLSNSSNSNNSVYYEYSFCPHTVRCKDSSILNNSVCHK